MRKEQLDAEWEAMTIEHTWLRREQQELEKTPFDLAAHEVHRRRLHAHIERLHRYHDELRAWHADLEREHAER